MRTVGLPKPQGGSAAPEAASASLLSSVQQRSNAQSSAARVAWSKAREGVRRVRMKEELNTDGGLPSDRGLPTTPPKSKCVMPFGDTVTCVSIDDADFDGGGIFAAGGITGGVKGKVVIYDLTSCQVLRTIHTSGHVTCCKLSRLPPGKRALIIGTFGGLVETFDVDTGQLESTRPFDAEVHSIAISRRSTGAQTMATAPTVRHGGISSRPALRRAYSDPRGLASPATPSAGTSAAGGSAASVLSELVAVGGKSHDVTIFVAHVNRRTHALELTAGQSLRFGFPVRSVDLSHTGTMLLVGGDSKEISIWELSSELDALPAAVGRGGLAASGSDGSDGSDDGDGGSDRHSDGMDGTDDDGGGGGDDSNESQGGRRYACIYASYACMCVYSQGGRCFPLVEHIHACLCMCTCTLPMLEHIHAYRCIQVSPSGRASVRGAERCALLRLLRRRKPPRHRHDRLHHPLVYQHIIGGGRQAPAADYRLADWHQLAA